MNHEKVFDLNRKWWNFSILLAYVIPTLLVIYLLVQNGTNAPYWDEWETVKFFHRTQENGFSLHDLLSQRANEHPIAFPVLVQCMIWAATDCNNIAVLIISQIIHAVPLVVMWKYWRKMQMPIMGLLPVAPLMFSLKQGMMLFSGFCIMWWLLIATSFLSFFSYYKFLNSNKKIFLLLTVVFGVLSSFSAANGLLIWCAYGALFLVQSVFEKKAFSTTPHILIIFFGVLCWLFYILNLPEGTALRAKSVRSFLGFLIVGIGNPFFNENNIYPAFLLGVVVLFVVAFIGFYVCLNKKIDEYIFPILLIVFFGGSMMMVAYGRAGIDPSSIGIRVGLISQYSMMPICFLVAAYILVYEFVFIHTHANKKLWISQKIKILIPFLIYVCLFAVSYEKLPLFLDEAKQTRASGYVLQHSEEVPETFFLRRVHPFYDLTDEIDWMKENHLFLFHQEIEYPYDDLANVDDKSAIPEIESDVGIYCVDELNGNPPMEELQIHRETGVSIAGWAIDDKSGSVPYGVWIEIDGQYFRLSTYARPDVADALQNNAYENSGIGGYIPTLDFQPGVYELNLIISSSDNDSYSSHKVCLLNIQED